ncbi:SET domain-containing protein SmydA-8 [Amyelois transitella]|uniref:SET domain-containing protein SmydA-8 n=1 Tax=Amyelois transitella TaxID=680683 RepID=UPI00298FFFA1|nr:SET domain-containing protein SmydA-8 [Amyelois transitella]
MINNNLCRVCLTPTEHKCSGCQEVNYCTREHQKQDWKQHRTQCVPARVREDDTFGRYLEATREIKAGDIVIKENPLITGPTLMTPPVCLGCYKLLEEDKTVDCVNCGWPCCSDDCARREEHAPECFYTRQRGEKVTITTFGVPHPNYQCISTLRCLYQRDHNLKLWEKLQALQSHCGERRATDKWNNEVKMIAEFILKFFKLEGKFSEEEIMRCYGILQVNGHEVPLTEPEYLAVFDRLSMVEHNCRPNCNKSFTSDGQIILCAMESLSPGAHITLCYTDALWGTEQRRRHLAEWFFECCCARCCDVTEFGTNYSAVKCKNKDCSGFLLPKTFIVPIINLTTNRDPATSALDSRGWVCGSCKDVVSDAIIQQLLQNIGRELGIMAKVDADACERFISHCSSYLHPSHYYMTDVSLTLAQMIGQETEMGLSMVTDDRLMLKTQLCKKISKLLETIAPAESRIRGSLLFELHAALAETARRRMLTEGPATALGYFSVSQLESRKILMESASLLKHEPPELPEGWLLQQTTLNLPKMDELIRKLSNELPSPL